MSEIWSMEGAISDGTIPSLHHGRARNSVLSCVFRVRSNLDDYLTSEDRSIIGNIIYSIKEHSKRPNMSTKHRSTSRTSEKPLDSTLDRRSSNPYQPTVESYASSDDSSDIRPSRSADMAVQFSRSIPIQAGPKIVQDNREPTLSSRTQDTEISDDSGYQSDRPCRNVRMRREHWN